MMRPYGFLIFYVGTSMGVCCRYYTKVWGARQQLKSRGCFGLSWFFRDKRVTFAIGPPETEAHESTRKQRLTQ